MAKKHNGLVLLGAAALGVAVGAYLYFKKTDADRFDDDDFDLDEFAEESEAREASKRSYVPLNLDGAKSEDVQAEKTADQKSSGESEKKENTGGEAEPFDEEDEAPIDDEDVPVRTTAMSGAAETNGEFFDEEDEIKEDKN